MNKLSKGEYFGRHNKKLAFNNIIITDTEYTHKKVDWHYHENPYFTYLIQGKLFEANKKEAYNLKTGSLLFHNWQDAHYNIKPPEFTRGFHIELNSKWFKNNNIVSSNHEGSIKLQNPRIKKLMNLIFIETQINDELSQLSIDLLILDIFSIMESKAKKHHHTKPKWVNNIKELIFDDINKKLSLPILSEKLNIHPVHLSRDFTKHYGISLGQYIRLLKVNKALLLIVKSKQSLTEISYNCGFYDQSHFILNFKKIYKMTPSNFIKKIRC